MSPVLKNDVNVSPIAFLFRRTTFADSPLCFSPRKEANRVRRSTREDERLVPLAICMRNGGSMALVVIDAVKLKLNVKFTFSFNFAL